MNTDYTGGIYRDELKYIKLKEMKEGTLLHSLFDKSIEETERIDIGADEPGYCLRLFKNCRTYKHVCERREQLWDEIHKMPYSEIPPSRTIEIVAQIEYSCS